MGRNIELPEMPNGFAAVVSWEGEDGSGHSRTFGDGGDAWALFHRLRELGRHVRMVRVEVAAECFADPDGARREALGRREREAYEAFLRADWRAAGERLGEWLDAWRELRDATEEGR